jgi:hypothetical protein
LSCFVIIDTAPQLAEVRTWLKECYEEIGCFLLPDPGKRVKKVEFQGQMSALEDDFRQQLEIYVPHVLNVSFPGVLHACIFIDLVSSRIP